MALLLMGGVALAQVTGDDWLAPILYYKPVKSREQFEDCEVMEEPLKGDSI